MVKNGKFLQDFEDEYIRNNKMTVQEKFDLSDDLYKFAFSLGKLTIDDSQQNLETLAKTLKKYSGMLQSLLIKVVKELDKNSIQYIIIGGQAAIMHGVVRATQDIDITLSIDISEIDKLKKIVSKLKLLYINENPDDFAKKFWIMPVYELKSKVRVDFTFSFSPFERKAYQDVLKWKSKNTKVKFCSVEDLIVFKIVAGRAIDLFDVRNILLVKDKLDKNYIKHWLKLFEESTNEKYLERFDKILKSIK